MHQLKQAYRWRVIYADGTNRDVGAFSEQGARAVGLYVARLLGCRGEGLEVVAVTQICKHGSPRKVWVETSSGLEA